MTGTFRILKKNIISTDDSTSRPDFALCLPPPPRSLRCAWRRNRRLPREFRHDGVGCQQPRGVGDVRVPREHGVTLTAAAGTGVAEPPVSSAATAKRTRRPEGPVSVLVATGATTHSSIGVSVAVRLQMRGSELSGKASDVARRKHSQLKSNNATLQSTDYSS
jgi:hypothetical protein